MWLSKKLSVNRRAEQEGAAADMGVTTIGGACASVMTRGEQRDLPVFSPGGFLWQPRAGDTVLVIKGGSGCQEQCVVAAEAAATPPEGMAPGEVFLYSAGGSSIYIKNDGSLIVRGAVKLRGDLSVIGQVALQGRVDINGKLVINGEPYRPCTCAMA